jgi:methylated-DNA-[protein]-cysteine S-methyltransferase
MNIERALRRRDEAPDATVERFVARARRDGLMDVACASFDSPFGEMFVAATTRGVVSVALSGDYFDKMMHDLAARVSPRVLSSDRELNVARRQLDRYFAGKLHDFDVPLDWQLSRGFALRVLKACARIPYGAVSSYRDMARAAGNVAATRAAGNALGGNPIPIIVPCHRVLRSGGAIGGYGGGLPMKEGLLRLEGALL